MNIKTLNCKAVALFSEGNPLSIAVEFTIKDGKVVACEQLNAADLPASAIGRGTARLWNQFRSQKLVKNEK